MPLDYTYDRIGCIRLLQEHTDAHRFKHSIGVEQTAVELARRYGADEEKAGLAGMMHDITKHMDNKKLADEYGILGHMEKTLHGPTAAIWLWKEGYIVDGDVLNAIRYHTTGRESMSPLEKIIYIADCIEPGRDYPEVEEIREAAEDSLDKAVLVSLERSIRNLLEKERVIDLDTVRAYNYYRALQSLKE